MLTPVISIKNVSKVYNIVHPDIFPADNSSSLQERKFWALRNIDIEIKKGDVVGLIGKNGSGKSTLLKILSGITKPSSGEVHICGSIASILEIGAGFNMDLTGRENIFLYYKLMGREKKLTKALISKIIEYSGIPEKFIDVQLKHYSSGMYMRLAFSLITNLETEIVIFDEVMAVGDAAFRLKCAEAIANMAGTGMAILLASHDPNEILNLCNKCICLKDGEIYAQGETADVIESYYTDLYGLKEDTQETEIKTIPIETVLNVPQELIEIQQPVEEYKKSIELNYQKIWDNPNEAPRSEYVRLRCVSLRGKNKKTGEDIYIDDTVMVEVTYETFATSMNYRMVILIHNQTGAISLIDGPHLRYEEYSQMPNEAGLYTTTIEIPPYLLNTNMYFIGFAFSDNLQKPSGVFHRLLAFTPKHNPKYHSTQATKFMHYTKLLNTPIRPNLAWQTNKLSCY